ncbi:hypothetical protein EVAR_63749_1 [Eumeta japonica]|uniref:F-box domain-containing protein n=1 Tax=Eumeta variegata TaxID=151549 RepID=A0A4C1ZTJ2_EUMVA|nr:hypothetical protein EVAR_63749_1 [Eumeta japonica]
MEPSNSQNAGDEPEGTSKILIGNNSENKTDDNKHSAQKLKEESSDSNKEEENQADDIERKDFEEESKVMTGCTGAVVVEGDNPNATASLPENLACANLNQASSSNYRSQANIPVEDSNATIRNMIRPKRLTFGDDTDSTNGTPDPSKRDLATNLINTSAPSTSSLRLEDFNPRSRNRAELNPERPRNTARDASEQCDLVSGINAIHVANGANGESSSRRRNGDAVPNEDNQVPSTSGAGRSSGYDNMSAEAIIARAQQISIAATRATLAARQYLDTSEDEYSSDELLCTCLSSTETDEDEFEEESMEQSRVWTRKRKMEPLIIGPPPAMKKYCMELRRKVAEVAAANRARVAVPGPSSSSATTQGPPDIKQWLNRFQVWSNNEKIQALDALITHCSASQVRHVLKAIEPMFQRDFISLLPKELALTVLGYLRPKDLLRAAQTCKYWQFLADDNLLWKEQCRRIGITSYKKIPKSLSHCASPWKAAYMRQYLIEDNWLHKPVDQPIVMRGHDDHVITCLQFYGNRILSGSDDTTLKVWSAVTGKCLRTLVGHSGGVWSSQMVGDLVISGSTDRTLRVWNAKTGQCLKILAGHTSTVRCMHLYQDRWYLFVGRVVSGSRDATLRVWSIPEGKCLKVLIGHLAAVRCVQYDGKVVVSGAYDYFVKVWNPDTGECLHTLAGHTNRVYSLQFDGVHVVSGSLDTSIRVWDVESGQLKHTLIGHQSLTSGMELHSNILVSGNADSTVKVWDITTGHCLHTLSGPNKHQSAVTCLQSSNRFVITSSDDGTVKLWDVRTGEFIRNLVELSSGGSGGVVWRIRASATKLICAVGSRNGTEETKLLVLDFDVPGACRKCDE